MSGIPGQLNFYDVLLALSPPVLLVSALLPSINRMFNIIAKVKESHIYQFINDASPVLQVTFVFASAVVIYAIGHGWMAVTDMCRRHLPSRSFMFGDPFSTEFDRIQASEKIDKALAELGYEISSMSARDKAWMSAAYLQQHGNYNQSDRFNTLSIYCFSVGSVLALCAVANLICGAVVNEWIWIVGALISSFASWLFIRRSLQFSRFFSRSAFSGFAVSTFVERSSSSPRGVNSTN